MSPGWYRFKPGTSAGTKAIQQKSQGTPRSSVTPWVPSDLYRRVGFQGVSRVRAVEFIRPKQTRIWLCEGMAVHRDGSVNFAYEEKMGPALKPHISVFSFSRAF